MKECGLIACCVFAIGAIGAVSARLLADSDSAACQDGTLEVIAVDCVGGGAIIEHWVSKVGRGTWGCVILHRWRRSLFGIFRFLAEGHEFVRQFSLSGGGPRVCSAVLLSGGGPPVCSTVFRPDENPRGPAARGL